MTPTGTPSGNASDTPRPWAMPPERPAVQDAPTVSWGSPTSTVAPGASSAPPGPAASTPSSYPWAAPQPAYGTRSTAPNGAPNATPDRWRTYSSPQSAWPAPTYPGATDYYSAAATQGLARPANGSGSGRGWARVLVAFLLVLALGLGLGAGGVFALGWSGTHSLAGVTSPTSSNGSNGSSGTGTTVASSSSADSLEQAVEAAVQTVQPSVVEIISRSGRKEAIGSGDIVNANGYIVTNDHVVAGYRSFTVTLSDGSTQTAQLVGQDANDDLAVIKIAASSSLHPIAFADSSSVQLGQFAIAVGNPLALGESSSFGIVSALNRTASEAPDGPAGQMTGLIQTSAPLNPGNSGGALVNLQGQMIGMPALGAIDPETNNTADAIGYAIPSNRVVSVVNQLIQSGSAG